MTTCLVSYATPRYHDGQRRLVASARRFEIQRVHCWNRQRLERTPFFQRHRTVLEMRRGSGYWLWKPYIIGVTLRTMHAGDVLFYADAGIEIIRDPAPLVALCVAKDGLLLFAGHYDDVGAPGSSTSGKWTKRDCFVLMGCDEPRFHQAPMLDASFIVLMSSPRTQLFVDAWLSTCTDARILTDAPNVCGAPNLPEFIEHRHDQSVLSLLAVRQELELFRHPSQFGNHLKGEAYREPDEPLRFPYGSRGIFHNSPYPTLLDHHRCRRPAPGRQPTPETG